jgi:c-di-GMP-binding flagellar brake protein YcgR
VTDLSGSGLGFSSERAEQIGTKLRFKLILPVLPFNDMSIDGVVIHSEQNGWDEDSSPLYDIGLEYSQIKEADQESVFRFIVKRERKIRLEQRKQEKKAQKK